MPSHSVLLIHPGNAPFVQHAARALAEAGLLAGYATTFAYQPDSHLGRFLRLALRPLMRDPAAELARRRIDNLPPELVLTTPLPELLRMLAVRLRTGPIVEDLVWEQTERWFSRHVARRYVPQAGAVYSYEHVALEPFIAMKARGVPCFYDQPIAHHSTVQDILDTEYKLFPEVRTAYDAHLQANVARRNARIDEELQLADLVIAASSFTKASLVQAGVAVDRIAVVPYGAPPVDAELAQRGAGPLIFMSAGSQSVRKGTHYLLDAWRRLKPGQAAELWLVGRMALPEQLLKGLPENVVIRPSLARPDLYALYRRAAVLVFPSLCEGFGQVITEAMACGLPVITTPNTAGPDLLTPGRDGFIVPIRDAEQLAAQMQWCLEHPAALAEMGSAARQTAARWQWSDYRHALGALISAHML